jgi:Flp pilus assembly protein TadG
MRTPRRQQGQSLLVLVVLLGALIGALWWTTEAGSAVNEKQRLANAADAAALSAAVWQARALNSMRIRIERSSPTKRHWRSR